MKHLKHYIVILFSLFYVSIYSQNTEVSVDTLISQSKDLYKMTKYDSSLVVLNRANSILVRTKPDSLSKSWVDILYHKTELNLRLGHYKSASITGKKCIDLYNRINAKDNILEFLAVNHVATSYIFRRELDSAKHYLDRAVVLYKDKVKNKDAHLGDIYEKYGLIAKKRFDYDKAEEFYNKALAVYQNMTIKRYKSISGVYFKLAGLDYSQRKFYKALELYNKSVEILKKDQNTNDIDFTYLYNNIGNVYSNLGEYSKSFYYLNKALKIRLELFGENHPSVASSYNAFASVYSDVRDYKKATEYYLKSINIRKKLYGEGYYRLVFSYNNLAIAEGDAGNLDAAIEYYLKAVDIAKKSYGEKHRYVASIYGNLSGVYAEIGDFDNAKECIDYYMDITNSGTKDLEAADYLRYSEFYTAKKDYEKAVEYINKGIQKKKETLPYFHISIGYYYDEKGRALMKQQEYSLADDAFKDAVDIYKKSIKRNYSTRESNNESTSYISSCYKKSFVCNSYLGDKNKIFEDLENSRTRHLLESSKRSYVLELLKSDTISQRIKAYEKEVNSLQDSIEMFIENKDYSRVGEITSLINDNNILVDQLFEKLIKRYPEHSNYMSTSVMSYDEFLDKKILDKKQVAVSYIILGDTLWTATVSNKDIKVYKKHGTKDLIKSIGLYRKLISSKVGKSNFYSFKDSLRSGIYSDNELRSMLGYRDFVRLVMAKKKPITKKRINELTDSLATVLYTHLIGNISNDIKKYNNLLVIPDSEIALVPFQSLFKYKKDKKRYLVEDYNVQMISSLQAYYNAMRRDDMHKVNDKTGLLGVGIDNFSEKVKINEEVSDTINTDYNPNESQLISIFESRSLRIGSNSYSNLKYSVQEVMKISELINKSNDKEILLLNEQATEKNLSELSKKGNLKDIKTIHFATHGFFSRKNPDKSALVLYDYKDDLNGQSEKEYDGFLTLTEIMRLRINADLVILSACETGVGHNIYGDGLYGMAYAFYVAGAKNTVSSLWKVDDYSSSVFFIELYSRMKRGEDINEAINNVYRLFISAKGDMKTKLKPVSPEMKKLLKDDKYLDAYCWSAFTLW
ncbi:MAG: CHAT domain-containing protein [Bacteroidales bacterium]|nr:CHAT domain-containing protein [Bacteroidales bacterium]